MGDALFKLLVVDDDAEMRSHLSDILSPHYEVILSQDGYEAFELAKSEKPALILLDILMPGVNGLEIGKKLRDDPETCHIPILMLTAVNEPNSRITAFKSGLDDYVCKPFRPDELIYRVESKLRRFEEYSLIHKTGSTIERCGNLQLNSATSEALIAGKSVGLSTLEFRILSALLKNQDQLLTRAQLAEAAWGVKTVSDRNLDPHLTALRKKLSDFDHSIVTIYGSGYILKPLRETLPKSGHPVNNASI